MAYAEKRISTAKGSKGKVSWRARYKKPDGTWGSEPGFPTKRTALDWGEAQEALIREGRWIDPDRLRTPFGEFARKWMTAQVARGRSDDTRWTHLEHRILPRWEHTPLNEITWFDVESWSLQLPVAWNSSGQCVTIMSSIMSGAVDAGYALSNPLYGRKRRGTQELRRARTRKQSEEDKWAPPEVVLRLARRLGPVNGLHALTTAFTGPRWGEGAGLHRRNTLLTRRQQHDSKLFTCPVIRVDPEVGELSEVVMRGPNGERGRTIRHLAPPKNATSVRDIDVPPFLAALLADHLASWPHEYVFCTPSGTMWWRSSWSDILRPAADGREAVEFKRRKGGLPAWEPIMKGLSMRDLRHTHDTYQAQIGVHPVLAHEQAGHRYPGIKGTYQHPTPEMRQQRLDGLQQIFERAMGSLGWESIWES